jgi:hypothetical protein
MKKIGVILSLMVCVSAHAADSSNPYKPTIAMTNPETGEGADYHGHSHSRDVAGGC